MRLCTEGEENSVPSKAFTFFQKIENSKNILNKVSEKYT